MPSGRCPRPPEDPCPTDRRPMRALRLDRHARRRPRPSPLDRATPVDAGRSRPVQPAAGAAAPTPLAPPAARHRRRPRHRAGSPPPAAGAGDGRTPAARRPPPAPSAAERAGRPRRPAARACSSAGGSDLHLTVGAPPTIRLHGELQPLRGLRAAERRAAAARCCTASSPSSSARSSRRTSSSTSPTPCPATPGSASTSTASARPLGAAFRLIPYEIKPLEDLGMPAGGRAASPMLPRGFVLVTGPTGSGKSTTLAAIVDLVNRTRRDHIMTVEDPIEFLHQHKRLPGQPARGRRGHPRLPGRAQARAAPGPRHHPGRRDARPRDDLGRADRRRDRPPGLRHPAHADARRRSTASSTCSPPTSSSRCASSWPAPCRASSARRWCKTADGKGRVAAIEVLVATPASAT